MIRRVTICLIGSVLAFGMAGHADASAPPTMNVQGKLTDSTGVPFPTGNKTLTFSIYDSDIGGTRLWPELVSGEEHVIQIDSTGLWDATIGETYPIPSAVFLDSELWLNVRAKISAGVDPLTLPRVRLNSGPYAFYADNAMHADTAAMALAGDSDWVKTDTILYSGGFLGIVRGSAANLYFGDSSRTTTNFGVACTTSGYHAVVGGGYGHVATGNRSTISGGRTNVASGTGATVGGGRSNTATAGDAVVSGGFANNATASASTIGGGNQNMAEGISSTVAGGVSNRASGTGATVGGGSLNQARGEYAVVAGGGGGFAPDSNSASGDYATVPGGRSNYATGDYSFAAGRRAKATQNGSFVWADATDADFATSGPNVFVIRATGGVGIGTASPLQTLDVRGTIGNTGTVYHSDSRWKMDVQPLESSLGHVLQLQGVSYEWNRAKFSDMNFPEGRQIGVVAQAVENVIPEVVQTDENGFKSVDYARLVAVLIEAVKELKADNDELRAMIQEQSAER